MTTTKEVQTNDGNITNEHGSNNSAIKDDTADAVATNKENDDELLTKDNNNNTDDDNNNDNNGDDDDGDTVTDSSDSDFDPDSSANDSERQTIGDISYRRQCIVLYSEPVQRQKWDDEQVLPRVNWGDLFFDLFYVGATYNVSNIITDSPNRFGFLYSAGTYWPLQGIGHYRTSFDARFVVLKDNVYHRIFEMIHFLVLSVAVVAIRPVYIMATPSQYISMFMFSLALIVERCMAAMKYGEVYLFGIGQPTLRQVAIRELYFILLAVPFYIAAAAVSGHEYFSHKYHGATSEALTSGGGHESYATGSNYTNSTNHTTTSSTDHSNITTTTTTDHSNTTNSSSSSSSHGTEHFFFRYLAADAGTEETSSYPFNHIPIYLCLAGYVLSMLLFGLNVIYCFPKDGKHKEIAVPLNLNFMIHRHSEWIMLNLGESIFSLLIIDLPNSSNTLYSTFYCGLLAVIFLHTLHFRSQPLHAHHHAWRRSKDAGVCFSWLSHVYTLALVSLGASYTVFLVPMEIADETTKAGHRLLSVLTNLYYDNGTNNHVDNFIKRRWLAASNVGSDEVFNLDDYNHKVALLFSVSLATIFACLDLMTVTHLGFKECEQRCYCKHTKTRNVKGYIIIACRLALVVFTATMFVWEIRPKILSLLGLLLVLTQIMLRKLAGVYLRRRRRPKTAAEMYKLKKKRKTNNAIGGPSPPPQDPTHQAVEDDTNNNEYDNGNNGIHHEK